MSKKIKTILTEEDIIKNSILNQKIGLSESYELMSQVISGSKLIKEFRTYNPELVIFSEKTEDEDKHKNAYELAADMNALNPDIVIVLLVKVKKPEIIEKAMMNGIRLVLTENDLKEEEILDKIKKIVKKIYDNKIKITSKEGKVITLMSSKGGVGKTTASVNIAAEIKTRNKNMKVLLMDFDLQFGDVLVITKLDTDKTIMDLTIPSKIDGDTFKHTLVKHPSGFYVLGAPKRADEFVRITKERLIDIIKIAKNLFDYVIIDSMQGFQRPTIAAIENSDYIYIVTRSHIMELNNAHKAIKTLEQYLNEDGVNVTNDRCRLLLNQYEDGGVSFKYIKERIKYPIIGILPRNISVANRSNDYNEIIVNEHSSSDLGQALKKLVNNLLSETQGDKINITFDKEFVKDKRNFLQKIIGKK